MIIHIEICDVCKRIHRGGQPVTLNACGKARWDVGACCGERPFRVISDTDATRNHLLARVESLIVTELALMRAPV